MRRTIMLSAVIAALTAAGGDAAQVDPAPPSAPPPVVAPPPPFAVRIVPAPSAATPIPATAGQPLICRSTVITGSLFAKRKQCLTKAQWAYVDDAHEAEARKLMMDGMGKPGCGGPGC